MGKSSRRKRQRRAGPAVILADHAMGTLIGDHGLQVNYFPQVTADGAAPGLQPVQADLPARSQVFAGREADLAELLALLDPQAPGATPRVAVVSGMAGVGKSELAVHAAHVAVENGWFPGGVLFVTLHGDGLELAQIALDGFLSAVGIPGDSAPADPQARSRLFSSVIARYAEAGKPVLVVIDNAATAAQCELLVPAGGRAVVTSRIELAVLDARLLRLAILSDEAGADLLAGQLGVSVGADTRVTDHRADAGAVARLCGGLPLALRIVAAILAGNRARSLATMAADLRDARTRLDELEWEGGGEVLAVRAAFDVSHRGLGSERARVFHLLSVNPGPEISTPAAAVLADLPERTVRRHLEGLAGTHLIEPGSADGRWQMHDLIRIYAAEGQLDETDDARARLIAYYMNTANDATAHLAPAAYDLPKRAFAGRADALAWLDSEYPNLAAIALFPVPGPMFADVALGLWRYFELRRRIIDGIVVTGHALAIARQLGDRDRAARAQSNLSGLFRQGRMFDEALAAGAAAVAAFRSEGNQEGVGIALSNLAAAQAAAKRFEEAAATGREAAAIFRELGDRHREAIALGHISIAQQAAGQFPESITAYQGVLAVMREAGDRRGEGATLLNLGQSLKEAGRLDAAIAAEEQAAAVFAELGDRGGEGAALNNLGGFLYLQDRGQEAIPVLRAAIEALSGVGDAHSRGQALLNLGKALAENGQCNAAITAFTDAAADLRDTHDRSCEGDAQLARGKALLDAGRLKEATEALRVCAEIFRELGDRRHEGQALLLLGCALPQAQRVAAVAAFEGAVALFQEAGEPELERAAMKGLIGLKFPVPSPAEIRARVDAGSTEQVVPGLWVDVTVAGGQGEEERRRLAAEIRATMREAAQEVLDKDRADAGIAPTGRAVEHGAPSRGLTIFHEE
jgi:tetratricopeptide (TPR) repeat protein